MSRSKWSKCNQSIINSVRAFSQAENPLHYLFEVGVNEGLYCGTVWVRKEATSWPKPRGCMCGGACVWERKGGGVFAFHISCWNCRTTQWDSDPWVMCVVSPHCPVSQKNYQNECKERHCVIYTGTTAVTSYLTTFPISLDFQWSWPIYLCCGEINLDPWIGGKGKKTGENSIELHTISGTGIQISWGIRECIPITKRLCAGKDNRDF